MAAPAIASLVAGHEELTNDFAYEQLSPRAFEQLAVALVEPVPGAGLEVFW